MSIALVSALTCLVLSGCVALLIGDRTFLKRALRADELDRDLREKDRAADAELHRTLLAEVRELRAAFDRCGTCQYGVRDEANR